MSNAANEMHSAMLSIRYESLVSIDVSVEELLETVDHQCVNGWVLPMTCAERAKACKETVGKRFSIHFLNDSCLCLMGFLIEKIADVFRKLFLQYITSKALADVCSAAFISKNVAERGDVCNDFSSRIVA